MDVVGGGHLDAELRGQDLDALPDYLLLLDAVVVDLDVEALAEDVLKQGASRSASSMPPSTMALLMQPQLFFWLTKSFSAPDADDLVKVTRFSYIRIAATGPVMSSIMQELHLHRPKYVN